MLRQLYFFLSMLVHRDADGKSDVSMSNDKESMKLLHSIFQSIKCSEDAFNIAESKKSYALCDLGVSIIKRLAANPNELQESVSVSLPPMLYKSREKDDENDSLVGVAKGWLADEDTLAYFASLKLETNGADLPVTSEGDLMDSETEGSEMPLGKLLKRLKARAAKAKKEAGVDIFKMVKEIDSDNQGAKNKFESSNGHGYDRKNRRSDYKSQKSKTLLSESTDAPVSKRRRTSAQPHKSPGAISLKGSKRPTSVNNVNNNMKFEKLIEETSSEGKYMHEKTGEPAESETESELLSLHIKKKLISSKQKGKRADRDSAVTLSSSQKTKKSKKVSNTDSPRSLSASNLGMQKKKNHNSTPGLEKCTTKDKRTSTGDLIGCRIKVWWPVDKKYYEGVVKSFDTESNKHVILYDDDDVEVLRLDRERWELVDNGLKTKRSSSSKGFSPRAGSTGQRRKSRGVLKQEKKLGERSPSQVRRKNTQRMSPKERSKTKLKSKSLEEGDETPDVASPDISTKSSLDDFGSDKEPTGKAFDSKDLSEEENHQVDVEKVLSDDEEPEEMEKDFEDNEASSPKQQPNDSDEESGDDADEADRHVKAVKKGAYNSVDTNLSDDEPLCMWKQRSNKK